MPSELLSLIKGWFKVPYVHRQTLGDNLEFGGTHTTNIGLTTVAGDKALGTIHLPSSLVGEIKYVFVDLYIGYWLNSQALLNYLVGDTPVTCTRAGSTSTALTIPDGSFISEPGFTDVPYPGKRWYGSTDVKNRFAINETTTITLGSAEAHHDEIYLFDVQAIARVVMW